MDENTRWERLTAMVTALGDTDCMALGLDAEDAAQVESLRVSGSGLVIAMLEEDPARLTQDGADPETLRHLNDCIDQFCTVAETTLAYCRNLDASKTDSGAWRPGDSVRTA